MKLTLPLLAALLFAPLAALPAADKSLSDFGQLVRMETWAENWTEASDKLETRSVTAEVWNVAMQAVLDAQGSPRALMTVTASTGERVVQRATSNEHGQFAMRLQQGGVYVLAAGENQTVIRAWTRGVAPPSARDAVLLVSEQNVERGALGNNGLLADPRVRVGLAVAAIGGIATAVVLAVSDSGS